MIEGFLNYFKFTDGISTSDVLGWFFAVIGAIFIYRWIDNMQTSMSRHSMLREIESSFSAIYNNKIAKSSTQPHIENNTYTTIGCDSIMVRSVLHDFSNWEIHKENNRFVCEIVDSQRYLLIRNNDCENTHYYEWISTQALHEILLIAKRVEKMYKDNIIKKIDLSDMSYELIPLGMSGRIEMFKAYYSNYEADSIAYLVMQTVVACNKYGNHSMVQRFKNYYTTHTDIRNLFIHSSRIRKFKDFFVVRKFKSLMKIN